MENLIHAFYASSNQDVAEGQAAYMKDLFPFLGIAAPLRRQLQRTHFPKTDDRLEVETWIYALWDRDEREFQYAALDLAEKHKKLLTLPLLEELVSTKSWWDSVDLLASKLVGHIALPQEMDRWIKDKNMWIRRSALLFQLKKKEKTDEKRLFAYIERTAHEKEFFIRKAIGWALREYSKSRPSVVQSFVEKMGDSLSPLSIREGSKYL